MSGGLIQSPSLTSQDAPDCLSLITEVLQSKGVSSSASTIIAASWKPSTERSYSSIFAKWLSFCDDKRYSVRQPSVSSVVHFLEFLFKSGSSFSHINVARSALSSTYAVAGIPIGENAIVCRFMAGVRNLRTPTPKYPVFWKTSTLLSYLGNWQVSPSNLKDLTLKLTCLLACLSVQRVHTVTHIDCNAQFLDEGTYLFVFHDLKVTRHRPYFVISLPPLSATDPLGTAKLLKEYIAATKTFRGENRQLLLSYVSPHQPVSTDTVARWIRHVMSQAGIDTNVFKAHSVRGASSSAARECLVSIDAILRAGDWSSLSTFDKHYCRRPSQLPSCSVANALLGSFQAKI